MATGSSFIFLGVVLQLVFAELPSYIKVCKRNDPKINQCIINSIETLRPQLIKGIPELDVPAMEPLKLKKISVSEGGPFRAVGTDVIVKGASNFEIKDLQCDIEKLEFIVAIYIPFLTFDCTYDVDARVLQLRVKGNGPLKANATDIDGKGIVKGKKITKDGKTYVAFNDLDLKLNIKSYHIHLENLFNNDPALNEAVNVALNENKKELITTIRPQAERVVTNVLLEIANKITQHFTYEELFPEK
ncbi:protein takeout [Halyomorpha halys]|uniref:protein takeout n=1 Tax=Halyomorpha halys TaxID=286706 RepID=UPI0006D4DF08|nr:protein takeout-like [Halyomorpha halys]